MYHPEWPEVVHRQSLRQGVFSETSVKQQSHDWDLHVLTTLGLQERVSGYMKNVVSILLLVLSAHSVVSWSDPMKTNLLIVSGGSWTVLGQNDHISYFNKFSTALYSSSGNFRRVLTLPLAWTVVPREGETKSRLFPGDFDMYFAMRFGWLEPRIGFEIPMGYTLDTTWKKQAWIGAGNIRVQTGFSISRTDFEQIGLPFGVEAMVSFSVTDDNAWYKTGGVSTQLYIKSSYPWSKKLTFGAELATYHKTATWIYNNSTEHGITFLPAVSANYRMSRKWYAGAKAGFGPSFRLDHGFSWKSNAVDAGCSLLFFP